MILWSKTFKIITSKSKSFKCHNMTLKTWSRGKSKPIKNVVGLFVMTTNPKMFSYRHEVVLCFGKHDYCRIPLQNTEPSKTVVSSRFRFALPLQNPTTGRGCGLGIFNVFSSSFLLKEDPWNIVRFLSKISNIDVYEVVIWICNCQ